MSAILTGYKGAVSVNGTPIPCVREWGYNELSTDDPGYCSASRGAAVRTAGNKDWNAYWTAYGTCPPLAHAPGETLANLIAATELGGGITVASCLSKLWMIDYPVERGGFVNNRVEVECNGTALTKTGTASDTSIPNPTSASQLGASFDGTAISHITHMRLIIESKNGESYDSDGTNGYITRIKGNIDANAIIRLNVSPNFAGLPTIDTIAALVLGSGTGIVTPWTLTKAKLMGIKPVVEIEGENGKPKIVGSDLHFGFTGYYLVGTTPTVGSITSPNGAVWTGA